MHEDRFWESFSKGAEIWSLVVVVLAISLVAYVLLRLSTRVVADRRTRKILSEGMKEEDGELAQGGPKSPSEEAGAGPARDGRESSSKQ